MDFPVEALSRVNIPDLLAIAAMFWFSNSRMDKKFEKVDARFDKLEEKFTNMDRELCRLEGAFVSKNCCRKKEKNEQEAVQ